MSQERRTRTSRAEWTKRVARLQESGLTAEQFASELGIQARTLTYWKWLLRKEARGEARVWPSRKQGQQPVTEDAPAPFIEVRADSGGGRFALELRGGRRVVVPNSFDADSLRRLLAVLEGE